MQNFFSFVKNIYRDLPRNMNLIFNYRPSVKVTDVTSLNLDHFLNETYSSFQLITEKPNTKENQTVSIEINFKYLKPLRNVFSHRKF